MIHGKWTNYWFAKSSSNISNLMLREYMFDRWFFGLYINSWSGLIWKDSNGWTQLMGIRNQRQRASSFYTKALRWAMESLLHHSTCQNLWMDCKDVIAMLGNLRHGRKSQQSWGDTRTEKNISRYAIFLEDKMELQITYLEPLNRFIWLFILLVVLFSMVTQTTPSLSTRMTFYCEKTEIIFYKSIIHYF